MPDDDGDPLPTDGAADFIFEAAPDPDVFDVMRRDVVETLEEDYAHLIGTGVRNHARIDTVDIDPADWDVSGVLNGGQDVDFTVTLRANSDVTKDVLTYLRGVIDDRYGMIVRHEAVVFQRIGMRPNAWFVDAKIPPATDGYWVGNDDRL
jgi:hypothetical protein